MKFRNFQAGSSRKPRREAPSKDEVNGSLTTPASRAGHRERLRQRFLEAQDGSLTDEALLELLLSYAIVRRDVQPLAKSLLAKFGSLDAVLVAEPAALHKISAIKDTTVELLKLAQHFRNSPHEDTSKQLPSQKVTPPSPRAAKADEIAREKHARAGAMS
jgi:DNA repair protein RadC